MNGSRRCSVRASQPGLSSTAKARSSTLYSPQRLTITLLTSIHAVARRFRLCPMRRGPSSLRNSSMGTHAALPDAATRLLAETAIESGLRWGELTELRVKDLDPDPDGEPEGDRSKSSISPGRPTLPRQLPEGQRVSAGQAQPADRCEAQRPRQMPRPRPRCAAVRPALSDCAPATCCRRRSPWLHRAERGRSSVQARDPQCLQRR